MECSSQVHEIDSSTSIEGLLCIDYKILFCFFGEPINESDAGSLQNFRSKIAPDRSTTKKMQMFYSLNGHNLNKIYRYLILLNGREKAEVGRFCTKIAHFISTFFFSFTSHCLCHFSTVRISLRCCFTNPRQN